MKKPETSLTEEQKLNAMEAIVERLSHEIKFPLQKHVAIAYLTVGMTAARHAGLSEQNILDVMVMSRKFPNQRRVR